LKTFLISCLLLISNISFGDEVVPFSKNEIENVLISIKSNDEILLNIKLSKDGFIGRQGNGDFPAINISTIVQTDGEIFKSLVSSLDDQVFNLANIYDHPDKSGIPITYTITFVGQKPDYKNFGFRVGTETKNVGDLLPYFEKFIVLTVKLTDAIYSQSREK
jgi:hypothetical protein